MLSCSAPLPELVQLLQVASIATQGPMRVTMALNLVTKRVRFNIRLIYHVSRRLSSREGEPQYWPGPLVGQDAPEARAHFHDRWPQFFYEMKPGAFTSCVHQPNSV